MPPPTPPPSPNPLLLGLAGLSAGFQLFGGAKGKEAAKKAGKEAAKVEIRALDEQLRQLERTELSALGSAIASAGASGVKVGRMPTDREILGYNEPTYATPEQRYASSPRIRSTGEYRRGAFDIGGGGSVEAVLDDMAREFQTTREYLTDIGISRASMARYSGQAQGDLALYQSISGALNTLLAGFS